MKIDGFKSFLLIAVIILASCGVQTPLDPRPESWAQAVETAGLPNFFKVSPTLYRSQQPVLPATDSLKKLGVKTVANLRSYHSDRRFLTRSGINLEELTVLTWRPDHRELVRFLKTATDPEKVPVLVHCLHGADRTGAMCAAYRVVVQNWTKEEAIREMEFGGYGFHPVFRNLPGWVRGLDVERLRGEIGL